MKFKIVMIIKAVVSVTRLKKSHALSTFPI
jgi:hypothetical protein